MAQDPNPSSSPDWDGNAATLANEAFAALEKMFVKKRMLPLLDSQSELLVSILTTNARATMRWMAKIHAAGMDISTADDLPPDPEPKYGRCFDCNCPFHHPTARNPWNIKGKLRDLCCTCADKRAKK